MNSSAAQQYRSLAKQFGYVLAVTDSRRLEDVPALQGAVINDDSKDKAVWAEYLENVMKKRRDCAGLYAECKERNA